MSTTEKSNPFIFFASFTRLFSISGWCFFFRCLLFRKHLRPTWGTKSEPRHFHLRCEWNKLIVLYNRDELDPVTWGRLLISTSPTRDTKLLWKKTKRAGFSDWMRMMRCREKKRGSVSSWVHPGSGRRMWIEMDDKNRGKCVFVCGVHE